MPSKDARSPDVILESIKFKSNIVKQAANSLTARIKWMQEYLSQVPGRVETFFYTSHPDYDDDDQVELIIRLHRQGKDWILSYDSFSNHIDPDAQTSDWKPLVDGPLKIKMAALSKFPELLERMEASQDELITSIQKTTMDFDKFSAPLIKQEQPTAGAAPVKSAPVRSVPAGKSVMTIAQLPPMPLRQVITKVESPRKQLTDDELNEIFSTKPQEGK